MQRKPGGYRKPTENQRKQSMIEKSDFNRWFRQIWNLPGTSLKKHPAPYPFELANRLILTESAAITRTISCPGRFFAPVSKHPSLTGPPNT
jgi:DNA modification methylase